MHSIYQRISSISALVSSCLLGLVAAITLSSLLFPATLPQEGILDVYNVKVHRGHKPLMSISRRNIDTEFAFAKLNVSADLTPLFNWNTKQLFLYVDAEYLSADGTRNTVTVWDRIVRRKEDARIKTKVTAKYPVKDMSKMLSNVSPANYTLRYNLMPHVGILTYGEAARMANAVAFPPVSKLS